MTFGYSKGMTKKRWGGEGMKYSYICIMYPIFSTNSSGIKKQLIFNEAILLPYKNETISFEINETEKVMNFMDK